MSSFIFKYMFMSTESEKFEKTMMVLRYCKNSILTKVTVIVSLYDFMFCIIKIHCANLVLSTKLK